MQPTTRITIRGNAAAHQRGLTVPISLVRSMNLPPGTIAHWDPTGPDTVTITFQRPPA